MVFLRALLSLFILGLLPASWALAQATDDAIPQLPEQEEIKEVSAPATSLIVNNYQDKMPADFFSEPHLKRGNARFFNALEIEGALRTRFTYFRDPHLRTFIPEYRYGTSSFLPNLSIYDAANEEEPNPAQNNFSGNMRLRLNPTIHVTETIRVRTSFDIFDNMVLGSTPSYMYRGFANPAVPVSMLSMSQNAPMPGINSFNSAIMMKRAWAEASFPIGELRFGRMPFHWGLGLLYNSGDGLNDNYGDQVDGILFSTRIFDHYLSPGYFIAYSGPSARGGGFADPSASNFANSHVVSELGQRYPLESGDMTHVFTLSFLKRQSDFITDQKLEAGKAVFNYGIFASYRRQNLDSQHVNLSQDNSQHQIVKRDGNVGLLSFWSALSVGTFHLEMELAGLWGKYQIGEKNTDALAKDGATSLSQRDVWLLQGGLAVESKYGFLSDRLQVGLDGGWASAQSGAGFGFREGLNTASQPGSLDGAKLPADGSFKTNFKFNPGYGVDLLMYREILGGISGTFYFKPHLSYFFSRNLGLRGDLITSFAPLKENTSGKSNFLGVELDASAFLRTDSGFYFSLGYGVLFPLKGLNHEKAPGMSNANFTNFGEARMAQTLQTFIGLAF